MTIRERIISWPAMSKASAWFTARSAREQISLALLAAIAVVALLYLAIWRPLASYRDGAVAEIARYDTLLAQARIAGASGLNLAGATQGAEPPSIPGSAASHGLLIRRIEPEGDRTRLAFEDADFARLVEWIAELEAQGIARVSAIQIDRRPAPGAVNAQVTLEDRS